MVNKTWCIPLVGYILKLVWLGKCATVVTQKVS